MSIDIKENKSSTKTSYRPEIDGLRAFAVVAVIINHFNKEILPGGYLGVDIFFVISGFVITSSLYQRPSKNFSDFIIGFYERRIKRLIPALSFFVLVMSITICLFNPKPILTLKTGLTSLFGFSNIFLFQRSTDYFALETELNAFTHTWSLGVEEQFYILFPLLIWFSGFGRQTKKGARNLFLIVGALTITSLIGFLYLYTTNQPAAYFLMPTRFWEMASGCLLFIGLKKRKSIEKLLEKVPPILVLALIVGIMYLPMSWATVSTVSLVALTLVLIASLKKQTFAFKIFTHPKVVYIGLISYSLYLWHWGVLSISRWTIGIHWWSVPFQVTLMLGLAIFSYRYLETPLRKGNWFGKRWATLLVGLGFLFTLSGGLYVLREPLGKIYLGKKNIKYSNYKCTDIQVNNCLHFLSKSNNKKNIWIIGDSIPRSKDGPMVGLEINKLFDSNVYVIGRGGNPYPSLVYTHDKRDKRQAKLGVEKWNLVMGQIQPLFSSGDTVILLNRTLNRYSDWEKIEFDGHRKTDRNLLYHYENITISPREAIEIHFSKIKQFDSLLKSKGINLLVVGPFHDLIKTPAKCLEINWFNTPACQNKNLNQLTKEASAFARNFGEKYIDRLRLYDINFVKVFDALCPEELCNSSIKGETIFRDKAHFSPFGAKIIAEKIIKKIRH